MSDANGNGSWNATTKVIVGSLPATGYNGPISSSANWIGISITLPPGKWLILTNILLTPATVPSAGNGAWVRLQWSSTQNTSNTSGITGSLNSGVLLAKYGLATGSSVINNSASANTTYYLNLSGTDLYGNYSGNWSDLGSQNWTENSIVAYPAN